MVRAFTDYSTWRDGGHMKINIANHGYTLIWDGVYYFALSNYPHISSWELKKLLTFIDFENRHGRKTEIICEDENITKAVDHAIKHPEIVEDVLLPDKITECTYCKQKGCLTKFVCHTATPDNAKKILKSGKLLSAVKVFGKTNTELVLDPRNAAGDPEDYFDYIMFAWGNCTAGDNLVMERLLGRGATDDERQNAFTPGIRFYFRYDDIIRHPNYVFDGYHPAKVKNELLLSDYLYACIVPEHFRLEYENLIQPSLVNRIHYHKQNNYGLCDWAEAVYEFIAGFDETQE